VPLSSNEKKARRDNTNVFNSDEQKALTKIRNHLNELGKSINRQTFIGMINVYSLYFIHKLIKLYILHSKNLQLMKYYTFFHKFLFKQIEFIFSIGSPS